MAGNQKKNHFIINGAFLTENMMGVGRFALCITKELDKLLDSNRDVDISIVISRAASVTEGFEGFRNIRLIRYGNHTGRRWEQLELPWLIRRKKAVLISLCNTLPLFCKAGIVCVHDIVFKTNPEYFNEPGDWHEILFRKMMYRHAFRSARNIITISNFSKEQIKKYYKCKNPDICVVGNGWQHFDNSDIDESIFEKGGLLEDVAEKEYYYYLASLAPNKNLKWIIKNAADNKDFIYVMSGKTLGADLLKLSKEAGLSECPHNIVTTGFVSDACARALMKNCKAFLFPSTYEGFGIPPMEALCMGATIVLGDIPVLHEIYGDSAYYVDCGNPDIDIDRLISKKAVSSPEKILSRYSWEKYGAKIFDIIKKNLYT